MSKLIPLFLLLVGALNGVAQVNLDFEKWSINHNGIDEARGWVNTSDATVHNAPSTLFKIVENPASGLASLKLTTAYWPEGTDKQLDTLVGALLQESAFTKRPNKFEFQYQSFPQNGDEILVGVQLTKFHNDSIVVIGEGFFTSNKVEKNWKRQAVNIVYYSPETPQKISLMALSSANAVITTGENGWAKIGSTLFLDDLKLSSRKVQAPSPDSLSDYYITVYPNPAKSFIQVSTNSPEEQQLKIYSLSSQLILISSFESQSQIDISKFSSGVYIYTVADLITGKTTAVNKFSVIR
jgi:hypothetical protein